MTCQPVDQWDCPEPGPITSLSFLSAFIFLAQDVEGVDLEMLAPYISMDDDFQLNFLSGLPEEADVSPTSSPERPHVTLEVPGIRKRYRPSRLRGNRARLIAM